MRSVSVTLPQPGDVEFKTGARVVLCLETVGDALHDELRKFGFAVEHLKELHRVCEVVRPDESVIVVCDTSHSDWLRELADLVMRRPAAKPVLLARLNSADGFLAALSGGVAGFCAPDATASAIVRTINAVDRTGTSIPRHMVPLLVRHVRHGSGREVHIGSGVIDVSEREWMILQLLMQRRSTREMAEAMFVSEGTIRCHISTLLKKLGAADREHAVALVEGGRRGTDA